jgi:hypothetical protein
VGYWVLFLDGVKQFELRRVAGKNYKWSASSG